jgi:hypothetical protein
MSKTIVNLTPLVVIEEIEMVLEKYPYHPYQQTFAIPNLRQNLIGYVLRRTSNRYTVIEERGQPIDSKFICYLDKKLERESIVAQGIENILQQNAGWETYYIAADVDLEDAPSHWFG